MTNPITRIVLGTDRVREWRPVGEGSMRTRDPIVGAWLISLVAGASESDSEDEAETARDLACIAWLQWSWVRREVERTVCTELESMGCAERISTWRGILAGMVRPDERQAEALAEWTGEPTDMTEWED